MREADSQCLAIGFFDGVHLGHQKILCGASAALTFSNHPLSVLAPDRAPRLIMSVESRVAAIRACGVSDVAVLDFTSELAAWTPDEFIGYLASRWKGRPLAIRCGQNWHFGKDGAGDGEYMLKAGLAVEVVPYAEYAGERISSSRIRECIVRGEIAEANEMMGRSLIVCGSVQKGKGLGAKLGYPTINVQLSSPYSDLNLPHGVYEVSMNGTRGIANYGFAPTMGDRAWRTPVLEIHLLENRQSFELLENDSISSISIIRFIRPERKFASADDLKHQIAADCAIIGP